MPDEAATTESESPAPEAANDEVTDDQQEADASASDESQEDDSKDEAWDPDRARKKIAKLNSEAANLRKRVNEAPKAEDVAAKDKRIGDLDGENLRLRVGYELGLPISMVDRLKGSTREELIADAEQLVELIAPAKRPAARTPTETLRGGSNPTEEPDETDLAKLGERMFRS